MILRGISFALLALAIPLAAAFPVEAESVAKEQDDIAPKLFKKSDPAMTAAIAEARRTLPDFLAALAAPPPDTGEFAFKYPLGGWEHVWVEGIAHRGQTLTGRLANVPVQEGFRRGDSVTVPLGEISDWGYRGADGVMRGHRTTRVMLSRQSAADAANLRLYLGDKE